MPSDLDRLRIQRPEEKYQARTSFRGRLWLALGGVVLLTLLALYLWGPLRPAREVTVAVVSRLYPAQAFTVLNASGYVVAQRKAAVSSKSTGRHVETVNPLRSIRPQPANAARATRGNRLVHRTDFSPILQHGRRLIHHPVPDGDPACHLDLPLRLPLGLGPDAHALSERASAAHQEHGALRAVP